MRNITSVRSRRDRELRRMLEDQRDRILNTVRLTIREGREEGAMEDTEVQDAAERSEADVQSELEFALLQIQGETLDGIAEALERLDAGRYGLCRGCGAPISARRLQALPFATRCRDCEQKRESKESGHPPTPSWKEAVQLLEMRG